MNMKNISAKWKWIAGIVIVLLILLFAGRVKRNGGSVTVPKHVSFVQQAKGSGTHVWFMTTGKAKTSNVYYIVVLKNGKSRTYRVYDDNTTLGKISKMSNGEVIRYAKQQDKKYFEASAKEAALANDRDVHDGFNADFKPAITLPSFVTLSKDNKLIGTGIDSGYRDDDNNILYVTFNPAGKMTSSAKGLRLPSDVTTDNIELPTSTDTNGENKEIINRVYDGLIDHIHQGRYHAPQSVAVKAKTRTDDSGNDIVEQKVTIQYTNNVDSDQIADNFLAMAEKNSSIMKQLYNGRKKIDEAGKDDNSTAGQMEDANSAFENDVNKLFTKKFCSSLTKDVFGNYQEKYTLNLEEPADFDIYDARFIGYYRGSGNGYLVTKAQNDKQTAVFAK